MYIIQTTKIIISSMMEFTAVLSRTCSLGIRYNIIKLHIQKKKRENKPAVKEYVSKWKEQCIEIILFWQNIARKIFKQIQKCIYMYMYIIIYSVMQSKKQW